MSPENMNPENYLMEQLASPENLLGAWRAVRGNIPRYRRERSAGPDGLSLAEFERNLSLHLTGLRLALLKGRYQPQPASTFTIPKRSGGERRLVVLSVADRVAQRAAQQVIEPLYEPAFLPCSFGFRPGRSVQDAVAVARRLRSHGSRWVVDGDIAACFDSLDHRLLIQRLARDLRDRRVVDLLEKWLAAGVLEAGAAPHNESWLSQEWERASGSVRRGVTWATDTLARREPSPYGAARWPESLSENPAEAQEQAGAFIPEDDPYHSRSPEVERELQRQAARQAAAGAMVLGAGWARRLIAHYGPLVWTALKTTAGQEALRRALLVGGGAAGAAAGVALSGYLLYRQVDPGAVGVLQGSPLSPLLANIYLHSFDLAITRAGFYLVRYADDWVILCAEQRSAEQAYNQAVASLARLHLKVNPEKTRILSPDENLEWLGEVISPTGR